MADIGVALVGPKLLPLYDVLKLLLVMALLVAAALKLDIHTRLWQHCYRLCGAIMAGKFLIASVCIIIMASPVVSLGASSEVTDSSYWSNLVHEENSVVASVLLIPYIVGQIPIRLIDGIISPKPASMSSTPPPAHKLSH